MLQGGGLSCAPCPPKVASTPALPTTSLPWDTRCGGCPMKPQGLQTAIFVRSFQRDSMIPLCLPTRTPVTGRGRCGLATTCRCLPEATRGRWLSNVSLNSKCIPSHPDPHEEGDGSLHGPAPAWRPRHPQTSPGSWLCRSVACFSRHKHPSDTQEDKTQAWGWEAASVWPLCLRRAGEPPASAKGCSGPGGLCSQSPRGPTEPSTFQEAGWGGVVSRHPPHPCSTYTPWKIRPRGLV